MARQRPRLRAVRRLEHRALGAGHQELEIHAYRALHPEGQDYTWWSNRGAARANDVGWRIDYQIVTPSLRERLQSCSIYTGTRFSDHAPFTVDYAG